LTLRVRHRLAFRDEGDRRGRDGIGLALGVDLVEARRTASGGYEVPPTAFRAHLLAPGR